MKRKKKKGRRIKTTEFSNVLRSLNEIPIEDLAQEIARRAWENDYFITIQVTHDIIKIIKELRTETLT